MLPPQLPLDLIRPITSEILFNRDLCSLALASEPFRREAQRILFFNPDPGRTAVRHFKFLDTVIASPDRLALLVNTYTQVYVRDDSWYKSDSERLKDRTGEALRCMKNLKHLAYRSKDESTSARILKDCDFNLLSFRWGCHYDERFLVFDFLPLQTDLQHLTLVQTTVTDELWDDQNFLDAATRCCPNLTSLSGPQATIDLFLFGRTLTYLQWDPDYRDDVDEVVDVLSPELNRLKYLTYGGIEEGLPLESIIGNLRSLTLLEVTYDKWEHYYKLRDLPELRVVIFSRPIEEQLDDADGEELATDVLEACSQLHYVDIEIYDESYVRYSRDSDGKISCHHPDRETIYSWQLDVCFGFDARHNTFRTDGRFGR